MQQYNIMHISGDTDVQACDKKGRNRKVVDKDAAVGATVEPQATSP